MTNDVQYPSREHDDWVDDYTFDPEVELLAYFTGIIREACEAQQEIMAYHNEHNVGMDGDNPSLQEIYWNYEKIGTFQRSAVMIINNMRDDDRFPDEIEIPDPWEVTHDSE